MLIDLLNHRRAVRHYDPDQPIDADTVRGCLEQARLAPSRSNMQLYQFVHVTDPATLQALATACLGQQAATTAQQMVVFVTRQDRYRDHARQVMALEAENIRRTSPPEKQEKRLAANRGYYGKLLPFVYARCFGLLGCLRKTLFGAISLFRPMYTDCSEADMRVVVHKSCALAAQTFMLAMSEAGYDTCPLEGLDSRRVKRILALPRGAEINMIVSCGIRQEGHGIWGERHRLPFAAVYRRV
ncbi:nitroreductase family protein [uncultured Cardiobacterium sp.]|uniref:nitroreductase family protein n=1 Tax=uncultured Cardiobacterium sp. TaxID=417619 RepID=UPI002630F67B|nr:nitroreductase family protein [uncultured Cardiobacterium sp.]